MLQQSCCRASYIHKATDMSISKNNMGNDIVVIVVGLTFWANVDSRIDTTMTILLSVSALYVVILSNIPLLGYLTR